MDKKYDVVLLNKMGVKLYINFKGVFPNNKWANPDGKFYLTKEEYDWIQINLPEYLEDKKLVVEGSEEASKIVENKSPEERHAEFFAQHVNKAKAQASKMEDLTEINDLINYANDNEINNKAVDSLVARANELGE